MRIFSKITILAFLVVFLCISVSNATVIEYSAGDYFTPDGWDVIAEIDGTAQAGYPYYGGREEFYHGSYYQFGVIDVPTYEQDGLNIVFHNVINSPDDEYNILNVYLYNDESTLGLQSSYDGGNANVPNWEGEFNATHIGSWTYTGTASDVVFSVENEELLAIIHDGGTFGIGFDPDCKYTFDSITVETPVPEPATLFLLGTGLLGFAGSRRRKAKK